MRLGTAAIAGLLLALAPIFAGCGDEQTTAAGAGTPAGKGMERAVASPADMQEAAARRCRGSLGELLDSMESLSNTVAVGLAYGDYVSAVNRVRATYAKVEADELSFVCLARVAGPVESALNAYIDAANVWGGCLSKATCEPESVEPALQRGWAQAAELVSSAQDGLRAPLPGRTVR